jgi:hypothetical protein
MGSKVVGVIAALSIFGSVAWATTTGPPSHKHHPKPGYGYGGHGHKKKVTLCHHTGSKRHPYVTIRVSQRAVRAHLRHGDKFGPCKKKKKKHYRH